MAQHPSQSQARKRLRTRESLVAGSFLLPSLVGLVCFSVVPMLFSLFISFTDWNFLKGIGNWNIVGFKNFIDLWKDEWFIASLKNTIIFTIVTVPVGLFLAMILAALIDSFCAKRLQGLVRITMYMPKICNIVASSAVWIMLYSSYGPFTQLMRTDRKSVV